MKYVNHLSPKHDYGMFNNMIKPYAADQYGLRIFQLTIQYYVSLNTYTNLVQKKKIHRKVYNYKNVDWIKLGAFLSVKCSID